MALQTFALSSTAIVKPLATYALDYTSWLNQWTAGGGGGGGGSGIDDGGFIPDARKTIWQPGVTYNGGIPTGRTQSGATLSPLGQKGTFTGTLVSGSTTVAVTGLTGTLTDCVIFDAAMTMCFGWVISGAGTTWNLNDGSWVTATAVAMVAYGNDTPQIQNAIDAAVANSFVKLGNGTFNVVGNGVRIVKDNVTLRGSSQWSGKDIVSRMPPSMTQTATTIMWKADNRTHSSGLLFVGNGTDAVSWGTSYNLASDAVKGSKSLTLTGPFGGSVGDLVLVDMVGDADPNLFFGNRNDLPGRFTGSLSGTSLSISSYTNGPTGVDNAANVTFTGTAMHVNSTGDFAYWRAMGAGTIQTGVTIFDTSNVFKGYITAGAFPDFTMNQSNAGTMDVNLGGMVPQIGWPLFDGVFSTVYGFIASGSYPGPWTVDRPVPTLTGVPLAIGGGTRRFFSRQDRALLQVMKITAIAGNTLTFETPFHVDFKTAYAAQVSRFGPQTHSGIGVEDLTLYRGGGGDGGGNLAINCVQYSWAKNVQSHYASGTGIGLYSCYRTEIRQCYMHETDSPNPGGGGYLCGVNSSSDCLVEDNEMWSGNKVIVGRSTGGGNVVGYNYMDDAMGGQYPQSPEAGVNMGHMVGSHMDLMEGNYTHRYTADGFWGTSPWHTVFRNWITGLRCAANVHVSFVSYSANTNAATAVGSNVLHFAVSDAIQIHVDLIPENSHKYGCFPAGTKITAVDYGTGAVTLNNNAAVAVASGDGIDFYYDGNLSDYYIRGSGPTLYPFADSWGRGMVAIQAHCYYQNIVGNVLGFNNQPLLGPYTSFGYTQTEFVYENLGPDFAPTGSNIEGYSIGQQQDPNTTYWPTGQDATIMRQGNYDYISTPHQKWHGIGGAEGSGTPGTIVNSYYLTSAPAFFGANPWPWVSPATGITAVLPAKARFAGRYATVPVTPPGNQLGAPPIVGGTPVWGDHGTKLVLSNGNRDVENTDTFWSTVRGSAGRNSGKWYFEERVIANVSTQVFMGIMDGITSGGSAMDIIDVNGCLSIRDISGAPMTNGPFVGTTSNGYGTLSPGSIVQVAVDVPNRKVWFGVDGAWLTNTGGVGDPVAGVNPSGNWTAARTIYPHCAIFDVGSKIRLVPTSTYYAPPTGYQIWSGGSPWTVPDISGTPATIYADFVADLYQVSGTRYKSFAAWLTAVGGTYSRASSATYIDAGIVKTAASNVPRLGVEGIRLTGAATNLHLQSQFAAGQYLAQAAGDTFVSNSAVAPDGTTTAGTLTPSTSAGIHNLLYLPGWNSPVGTNTCTYSVFAKLTAGAACSTFSLDPTNGLTSAAVFNLATGAVASTIGSVTAGMQPLANGWYLCWITFSMAQGNFNAVICALGNGTDANSRIYAGDGTSGYIFWGHQVTVTSFPTDYIPTTTATVTQAADALSFPYTQTTFSALVNVIGQQSPIPAVASSMVILGVSGNATIFIYYGAPTVFSTVNGASVLSAPAITGSISNAHKIMAAGSPSGRSITNDGNTPISDTNAFAPSPTICYLGQFSGGQSSYGNIQQMALWNGIVASAAEMQRLTT